MGHCHSSCMSMRLQIFEYETIQIFKFSGGIEAGGGEEDPRAPHPLYETLPISQSPPLTFLESLIPFSTSHSRIGSYHRTKNSERTHLLLPTPASKPRNKNGLKLSKTLSSLIKIIGVV